MDLIERLEAAGEGSRELETAIAMELRWWNKGGRGLEINDFISNDRAFKDGSKTAAQLTWDWPFPQWTRSIDAALTLVPEEWHTESASEHEGDGWGRWTWHLMTADYINGAVGYKAATPALALCSAALRARESSHDG